MQILIEIPVEDYAVILGNADIIRKRKKNTLEEAVLNGTPLPRNHGRLVDADEATRSCLEHTGKRSLLIDLAPTVIEADVTDINVGKKEEEEWQEKRLE